MSAADANPIRTARLLTLIVEVELIVAVIDLDLRLHHFGCGLLKFELVAGRLNPLVVSARLADHFAVVHGLVVLDIWRRLQMVLLLVHVWEWTHGGRRDFLALLVPSAVDLNAHLAVVVQPLLVARAFRVRSDVF